MGVVLVLVLLVAIGCGERRRDLGSSRRYDINLVVVKPRLVLVVQGMGPFPPRSSQNGVLAWLVVFNESMDK